jgi:hypothetical protein
MREVQFYHLLDEDNALRVRFELDYGQVLKFVVQLESRFARDEKWVPVVRYDTAHGFAHCDIMHPYSGTVKVKMPTGNYNDALTLAMNDIEENWITYRRRYEQWLRQK